MPNQLDGKRVAILVENGFEQVELTEPKQALEEAGARTAIVSPQQSTVRGWDHTKWGDDFRVDVQLQGARPDDFDAPAFDLDPPRDLPPRPFDPRPLCAAVARLTILLKLLGSPPTVCS